MRRAIATALVLGAGLAAVPDGTAAGAGCASRLSWHAASYRRLTVRGEVPLGRRLGRATLTSTCRTTHTSSPRASVAGTAVRRVVYSVDGIRPSVAVAIAGRRPVLFVSRRPATAAEIRVLNRIRGG